jgi:y4mF family transcriptional regulator
MNYEALSAFLKYHRKQAGLTQEELAIKAGVGLATIRDMEQGKQTLQIDSVNKVLALFGYEMRPSRAAIDPYVIWKDYFNKAIVITTKNRQELFGIIIEEIRDAENRIVKWKFVANRNAIAWQKKRDAALEEIIDHNDIDEIRTQ